MNHSECNATDAPPKTDVSNQNRGLESCPPNIQQVGRSCRHLDQAGTAFPHIMAGLTDEQAAIYDRQIRIWGAGVQQRLMNAKVLVFGCTQLAAEVTKNFVLAGVGNVTLIDDTASSDLPTTFLSMHDVKVSGGSAAHVFAAGLQEMNPMIKVVAMPGSSSALPKKELIEQFHLVLCFGQNCRFLADVNDLCRDSGVKFMCAASRGGIVWSFSDLLLHSCSQSIDQSNDVPKRQLKLEYIAMRKCVKTPWLSMPRHDQRQVNGFLGPWTIIAAMEIMQGREMAVEDLPDVLEKGEAVVKELQCPDKFWDQAAVKQYFSGLRELAPANAIAGGFIANDVVRCVSEAGLPSYNVLFYSIVNNVAQVHNLASSESVTE
jgi:ubiquitin-like 1-activating enzyme E1 A